MIQRDRLITSSIDDKAVSPQSELAEMEATLLISSGGTARGAAILETV